jgi:hypothetical protein
VKTASADTYTGRTGAQRDTRDRDIMRKLESPIYRRNSTMVHVESTRGNRERKKQDDGIVYYLFVAAYIHMLTNCYMCRKPRTTTTFVNLKRLPSKSIFSNDVSQKSKYFQTTDIFPNNSDLLLYERLSAQQFLLKYIISNIDLVSALDIY